MLSAHDNLLKALFTPGEKQQKIDLRMELPSVSSDRSRISQTAVPAVKERHPFIWLMFPKSQMFLKYKRCDEYATPAALNLPMVGILVKN